MTVISSESLEVSSAHIMALVLVAFQGFINLSLSLVVLKECMIWQTCYMHDIYLTVDVHLEELHVHTQTQLLPTSHMMSTSHDELGSLLRTLVLQVTG